MKLKAKNQQNSSVSKLVMISSIGFVLSCGGSSKSSDSGDTPVTPVEAEKKTATTSTTSSSTTSSTSTTSTANSAVSVLNTLAAAVPGNLSLVAFSTGTSASLHLDDEVFELADDASKIATTSPTEELKEKQGILKGTAESCLSASFKKPPAPPSDELCYEFDSDMIQVSGSNAQGTKILGTKTGKNASGEACLVAFSRAQIVKIKDPLDRSQAILNAALCQANKDEKEKAKAKGTDESKVDLIPAKVGDSIDLAPYLKSAFDKGGRTKEVVSSITMTRLADVSDQKVYQTVFKITDDQSNTRVFTLNHSPKDATNEEYNGTLYFAVKPPKGKADPMAGANADLDFVMYVSIGYARTKNADGTYSMAYEARTGRFTSEIDPILSTGLLDFNASADFSVATSNNNYGNFKKADGTYYEQNKAGNGFAYITVTNTETSEGKLTSQKIGYWMNPGSGYKENARGMVFSAAPNATTGLMEGCANSGSASVDMGSGISIRRTLKEGDTDTNISLTPRGMYHPFTNTQDTQGGSAVITTNNPAPYKYKKVTSNLTTQWAGLQATGEDAVNFVEKQVAALMTSQCFKQNSTSGLWEIDTVKTTGADGFDIIKTTDTAKVLTPPPPPKPPLQTAGAGKIDFKPKDGKVSLLDD